MSELFEELSNTFPDSIIGSNAVKVFAKMIWDSSQAANDIGIIVDKFINSHYVNTVEADLLRYFIEFYRKQEKK